MSAAQRARELLQNKDDLASFKADLKAEILAELRVDLGLSTRTKKVQSETIEYDPEPYPLLTKTRDSKKMDREEIMSRLQSNPIWTKVNQFSQFSDQGDREKHDDEFDRLAHQKYSGDSY